MYELHVKNIFDHSERLISFPIIPREGETIKLTTENKFYIIHGITYAVQPEDEEIVVYAEPINEEYWINEI